jgi:hypothetical protein
MMRSRTEARWAAFFDALKWPWAYEPTDLDGYIPDFVLNFDTGPLLVEVKSTEEDIEIAKAKIEASGWEREAVIVVSAATPDVGAFLEQDGHGFIWGDAGLFYCLSCGRESIHAASGGWGCRICGASGGNAHVGDFDPAQAWAEAGNRVQWRAA